MNLSYIFLEHVSINLESWIEYFNHFLLFLYQYSILISLGNEKEKRTYNKVVGYTAVISINNISSNILIIWQITA